MSHFLVYVILPEEPGDVFQTLGDLLQPFHEYECTGTDDEFVVDVDVTDEIKRNYEENGPSMSLAKFASDWNDAQERDGRFYRRTNPNAKWDWWVVGGRWNGAICGHRDERCDSNFPAPSGTNNMMHNTELVETLLQRLKDDPEGSPPFAIVTPEPVDGEGHTARWFQRAKIGWFAITSDEQEPDEWRAKAMELYERFKGRSAVAVDCQI